jgi:hypothetical protein
LVLASSIGAVAADASFMPLGAHVVPLRQLLNQRINVMSRVGYQTDMQI